VKGREVNVVLTVHVQLQHRCCCSRCVLLGRLLLDPSLALSFLASWNDRLCGQLVRVLGYRSGCPGSISGTTKKKKVMGLERGPLSLVSTTEELLDKNVAAPV
jgi:hypothetical protein